MKNFTVPLKTHRVSKAAKDRCLRAVMTDAARHVLSIEPEFSTAIVGIDYPPVKGGGPYAMWQSSGLSTRIAAPGGAEHAVFSIVSDKLQKLVGEDENAGTRPDLVGEAWREGLRLNAKNPLIQLMPAEPQPLKALAHAIASVLVADLLAHVDPLGLQQVRRFPPILRTAAARPTLSPDGKTLIPHAGDVLSQIPIAVLFPVEMAKVVADGAGPKALATAARLPKSVKRILPASTGPIHYYGLGTFRRWATSARLGLLSEKSRDQHRQVSVVSALAEKFLTLRGGERAVAETALNWAMKNGAAIPIGRDRMRSLTDLSDWVCASIQGTVSAWVRAWTPDIGADAACEAAKVFARAQEPAEQAASERGPGSSKGCDSCDSCDTWSEQKGKMNQLSQLSQLSQGFEFWQRLGSADRPCAPDTVLQTLTRR